MLEFEIKELDGSTKYVTDGNHRMSFEEATKRLISLVSLLKRRIVAIEKLGCCYRLGLRPTEKMFDELDRTKRMLKKYE